MVPTWVILTVFVGCDEPTPPPAADVEAEAPTPAPPAEPEPTGPAIPERGPDETRASKNGSLTHEVGDAKVEVRFGRPEMRGRDIFGGIVAYDTIWRTGADEASVFATESDVLVEGEKLPAGVYALFTIPSESEWTVIFNEDPKQWGSFKYDEAKDALRVKVTPTTAETVEAFDIQGSDDGIVLRWADVAVPVTIAAAPAPDAPAPAEDSE